jgi:hypothetical protein
MKRKPAAKLNGAGRTKSVKGRVSVHATKGRNLGALRGCVVACAAGGVSAR